MCAPSLDGEQRNYRGNTLTIATTAAHPPSSLMHRTNAGMIPPRVTRRSGQNKTDKQGCTVSGLTASFNQQTQSSSPQTGPTQSLSKMGDKTRLTMPVPTASEKNHYQTPHRVKTLAAVPTVFLRPVRLLVGKSSKSPVRPVGVPNQDELTVGVIFELPLIYAPAM